MTSEVVTSVDQRAASRVPVIPSHTVSRKVASPAANPCCVKISKV